MALSHFIAQFYISLRIPFLPLLYLTDPHTRFITYSVDPHTRFKIRRNSIDKVTVWETWKLHSYSDPLHPLPPTGTVIDIGANIGDFSVLASRAVPSGRVLAYEPDPDNFSLLQDNQRLNHCTNLICFPLAVGDRPGRRTLFKQPDSFNAGHSLYPSLHTHSITVTCTSLDQIVKSHRLSRIDLLKIDAEGAEFEILMNTSPSTLAKVQNLIVEFHLHVDHRHTLSDLIDHLVQSGLRIDSQPRPLDRLLTSGIIRASRPTRPPL